jgi:hypothetical protein
MENKINQNDKNSDQTINHWMIKAQAGDGSAEQLWESAKRYFMWCEANPIYKQEMVRQTGALAAMECPRPFNLPALCLHCGITPGYVNDMARNTKVGVLSLVCQRILMVIYSQNLEYAMVGIFNPVISAKKLNLGSADEQGKSSATIHIEVIKGGTVPELADSEFEKTETGKPVS